MLTIIVYEIEDRVQKQKQPFVEISTLEAIVIDFEIFSQAKFTNSIRELIDLGYLYRKQKTQLGYGPRIYLELSENDRKSIHARIENQWYS